MPSITIREESAANIRLSPEMDLLEGSVKDTTELSLRLRVIDPPTKMNFQIYIPKCMMRQT